MRRAASVTSASAMAKQLQPMNLSAAARQHAHARGLALEQDRFRLARSKPLGIDESFVRTVVEQRRHLLKLARLLLVEEANMELDVKR